MTGILLYTFEVKYFGDFYPRAFELFVDLGNKSFYNRLTLRKKEMFLLKKQCVTVYFQQTLSMNIANDYTIHGRTKYL